MTVPDWPELFWLLVIKHLKRKRSSFTSIVPPELHVFMRRSHRGRRGKSLIPNEDESGHQLPLKLWFQPRRFLWTADTSRRILQENSSAQISCHPDERKSSSSFSSPPGGLLQQEVSPVRGFVFHRNIRLLSSTFVSFGEKVNPLYKKVQPKKEDFPWSEQSRLGRKLWRRQKPLSCEVQSLFIFSRGV